MVMEKLGSGLRKALEKITRAGHIDKDILNELARDIQRALLSSDVNVEMVFELTEKIKKRALKEKIKPGLTPREHVINVVYEELVNIMGEKPEISLKPRRILLVGLFGSGKTTSAGKLAKFYMKKGLKPALVGCDIHRPAAMEQIKQVGKKAGVPVHAPVGREAVKIAEEGLEIFKNRDVIIFDSSGRNALDKKLASELKKLEKIINPDQTLLVIPADLGQTAGQQAEEFKKMIGISNVLVTKMDGTAKAGGALTSSHITGAHINFIGTGEGLDDLEVYEPERIVSKMIGYGDLKGLIQKAKEVGAEKTARKIMGGKFTLNDFYKQIEQVRGMGSLSQIIDMIPGMGKFKAKIPKEMINMQEEKMKKFKYIIDSMTPQEKENADIVNSSRIKRIASGSGTGENDVRELLKLYKQSKKAMKMLKPGRGSGQIKQLMRQLGMG